MIEIAEDMKKKRMAEDAAFFGDPKNWPGGYCCVKKQPWIAREARLEQNFGAVLSTVLPARIIAHDGVTQLGEYATWEGLAEVWSVD